jgi:hypothetical protein
MKARAQLSRLWRQPVIPAGRGRERVHIVPVGQRPEGTRPVKLTAIFTLIALFRRFSGRPTKGALLHMRALKIASGCPTIDPVSERIEDNDTHMALYWTNGGRGAVSSSAWVQ